MQEGTKNKLAFGAMVIVLFLLYIFAISTAKAGDCPVSFSQNYENSLAAIKADPDKYKDVVLHRYQGERAVAFLRAFEELVHATAPFPTVDDVVIGLHRADGAPAGDETNSEAKIFWGNDGCVISTSDGVPGSVVALLRAEIGDRAI